MSMSGTINRPKTIQMALLGTTGKRSNARQGRIAVLAVSALMLLVVLLVCFLGTIETIAVITGCIFLAVCLLRPLWLISVLPFAGALNGWHVSIAGLNVRVDQAIAALLTMGFGWHLLFSGFHLKKTSVSLLVLLFILINIGTSALLKTQGTAFYRQ